MVLTGQKPISSFCFQSHAKTTNQVCKGNTEKSVLIFVLYPNITATAMDATQNCT